MQDILFNLALLDLNNFCQQFSDLDPSGTHLVKKERGFTYTLVRNSSGEKVISVTFHKHSVPTHQIY